MTKTIDYILSSTTIEEPNSFEQAMKSDEKEEQYKAYLDKNKELLDQNTFEIIDIPARVRPIKGQQVFKKKPINRGQLIKKGYIIDKNQTIRYKARWVIQGFY